MGRPNNFLDQIFRTFLSKNLLNTKDLFMKDQIRTIGNNLKTGLWTRKKS